MSGKIDRNFSKLDTDQQLFIRHKQLEGIKESTVLGYVKTFIAFNRIADEELPLEEQVFAFFMEKKDLRGGYNNYRKRLASYFDFLVEEGKIEQSPIRKLNIKYKKETAEPRPAKEEPLKKILEFIDEKTYVGLRDKAYILLTIDCGIRPYEATLITRSLLKDGNLKITPKIGKMNKSRVLPISIEVQGLIERLYKASNREGFRSDYIFLGVDGSQATTTLFQRRLQYYCRELDLTGENKITPYMLRHFFATKYLENGGNLVYLQYLMGHSDLDMTKKYLKINQEAVTEEHRTFSPVYDFVTSKKRAGRIIG